MNFLTFQSAKRIKAQLISSHLFIFLRYKQKLKQSSNLHYPPPPLTMEAKNIPNFNAEAEGPLSEELLNKFIKARETLNPRELDYCFGHANCYDNVTAQAVLSNYLAEIDAPNKEGLECLPFTFDQDFSDDELMDLKGKNVLFVDIAPTAEVIAKLLGVVSGILILEHHRTNTDHMKNFPFALLVTDLAGCTLMHHYCYGNTEPAALCKFVQARDTYNWKIAGENEHECQTISAGIYCQQKDFEHFRFLLRQNWADLEHLFRTQGQLKAMDDDGQAQIIADTAEIVQVSINPAQEEGEVPAEEPPHPLKPGEKVAFVQANVLQSEVGTKLLAKGVDLVVISYYGRPSETVKKPFPGLSFRSIKGRRSAGHMAKAFGGGGHPGAGGGKTLDKLAMDWHELDYPAPMHAVMPRKRIDKNLQETLKQKVFDLLNTGAVPYVA